MSLAEKIKHSTEIIREGVDFARNSAAGGGEAELRSIVTLYSGGSDDDMEEYRDYYNIPRNPVSEKIHISGECLCGAFSRPGEIEELKFWYPQKAKEIFALQDQARCAGIKHCVWGGRAKIFQRISHRLEFSAPDASRARPVAMTGKNFRRLERQRRF